ncbi:galactose/methyl galactoside ABC transporter ATP-binding protein MglA [Vallitalea sediminicola]
MSTLRTENISKQYPGTLALDNVTATFESGQVHALLGKNGSGKSTMVKIFAGAIKATSGNVYLDDEKLDFKNPQEAIDKGIATVYQELSLIPGMNVAENILLGRMPMRGKFIDWKKAYKQTREILEDLGVDIDPKEMVINLSMWQCQMIEIVKAMSTNPKVLMLDEPTSSLAQNETDLLFKMIKRLKKKDVIIIYISHRLQELWKIADTCTVLRDGVYINKTIMAETSHEQLIKMMFGDVKIKTRPDDLIVGENTLLEVKGLTRKGYFENISFEVKEHEILGIAGMLGSGRTELLRGIFGADKVDNGKIIFEGKEIDKPTPHKMKKAGFALTPEDRKHEGLIQVLSVHTNLCVASLDYISPKHKITKKMEKPFVDKQIEDLEIKVPNVDLPISSLSGGNQQKVVVGNWLNTNPKIMFFDEPSRGIDVNAKQQIFDIIWEQSRKGVSSIMVSSELEELLEVCHRILIISNGQIIGEVKPEDITVEDLYKRCIGGE